MLTEELYNAEFKKQYIEDDDTNRNMAFNLPYMFATIAEDEKSLGKDLCNFNIVEIQEYFNGLNTTSVARCLNIKAQFSKYSRYCLDRGLVKDHQIHWDEVDRDFIMNCINYGKYQNQLITREDLIEITDSLLNPSDSFVVLGIFEGICGNLYSDFRNLHINQFKEAAKGYELTELGADRRTLKVSAKLYEYAKDSSETYTVKTANDTEKRVYDESDPFIIKKRLSSTSDTHQAFMRVISNKLSKLKKEYDMPCFTQAGLTNSGRLAYIHDNIREGEDLEEFITEHRDEMRYIFGYYQTMAEVVYQYNELYGKNN